MLSWSTLSVLVLVALLQSTSAVPATVGMTFTYICSCSLIFTTGECPVGVPIARCFAHPCTTAVCLGVRGATCVADYCGGCNARWFLNGEDVTDRCSGMESIHDMLSLLCLW